MARGCYSHPMAVEVVFESAALPQDHLVWKAIAEAVLRGKEARVIAHETPSGWRVSIQGADGFSTIPHPHTDGDFEMELRRALRAAGIAIAVG